MDLAARGEVGLERAAAARYDLVVADVEMPGISRLDLVRRTRGDAALARARLQLISHVRGALAGRRAGR